MLTHPGAGWVGIGLRAALWALLRDRGQNATSHLAAIREAMLRACAEVHANEPPPAALTDALHLLILANLRQPDSAIITLVDDVKHRCVEAHPRIAEALAGACSPAHPMALPADPGNDTIVIIYSCRKYLGTRIEAIRSTWVRDLVAWGVPYLIVVGDGDDRVDGDVLALDVSDRYEDLPGKSLKMIQWVFEHTGYQHLYKIDDDCFVDVRKLFGGGLHRAHHYYGRRLHRDPGSTDRVWHQGKSSTTRAAHAIDKSPEPSTYADGGCGYNLSRFAMASILIAATSDRGQRLIRNSFMEDKLVGDLLSLTGISIADHDYHTMIRRRTFAQATPVNLWDNVFLPSRHSPTVMVHLDTETHMASVRAQRDMSDLLPKRLWPTHARPSLVWSSSQLEQLSPASRMRELRDAPMVVVAVARNESLLLPHFLAHYRRLGASHFVIVDNLSTDGTRELALEQPDVTVYSCDTDYKHSHFGVTWQETVLGAHRLGRWALVADLDEFLVYGDSDSQPLPALAASLQAEGADAARAYMIDMYPKGDLADADFKTAPPFLAANCHDRAPLIRWRLGAGSFSNAPTFVSALRHRLIPNSAPNMYTSQKIALLRYQPWMRFSEGLHYAAGVRMAQRPLAFAHFKYHRGFRAKVLDEVARKQHFDNASEYRRYMNMLSEASAVFFDSDLSQEYAGADSLCEMLQALQSAP